MIENTQQHILTVTKVHYYVKMYKVWFVELCTKIRHTKYPQIACLLNLLAELVSQTQIASYKSLLCKASRHAHSLVALDQTIPMH